MSKILVIEDEPQMRRNMLTILKHEGFEGIGAKDGSEGVTLAKRELPDLILCDVMMPGLDGYGVLAQLRAERATERIPFIFLTAKGEREDVRTGMNTGADDYLTKPVTVDDLKGAINARLTRRDQHARDLRAKFTSPEPLQALGLTEREAEVLFWVAQGKTNGEIAVILDASPGTIRKHIEHIFEKTGCENRGAATLLAVETLARVEGRDGA